MTSPAVLRVALLAGVVLLSAGCAGRAPSLVEAKREVAAYVSSSRYEAEIASVTAQAIAHLEARAREGGKLAIVLDVDETALSNLPSLRANDYGFILRGPCELPAGPCGLGAWIAMGQAEPIRPVLELARRARARGVAVFFLTGRPERLRGPTERNLKAAGYEWDGLILKPDALTTASAAEFKAPERRKLVDQGYTIVVNVGDQASDLDGGFAERTYKLPNPFYFVP